MNVDKTPKNIFCFFEETDCLVTVAPRKTQISKKTTSSEEVAKEWIDETTADDVRNKVKSQVGRTSLTTVSDIFSTFDL